MIASLSRTIVVMALIAVTCCGQSFTNHRFSDASSGSKATATKMAPNAGNPTASGSLGLSLGGETGLHPLGNTTGSGITPQGYLFVWNIEHGGEDYTVKMYVDTQGNDRVEIWDSSNAKVMTLNSY